MSEPDATGLYLASDGSSATTCSVRLELFEGPLDLLLHLIRQNEVEITDIPIAEIARQYCDYLGLMRELNLEVAGEYLVLAATLAWIKSRMILPLPDGQDEEEGMDPRAELQARLLEYQRFKEAAEMLAERPRLEREVFVAHGLEVEPTPDAERELRVGLLQLVEALRKLLRDAQPERLHEIEVETVTVQERMEAVMRRLEAQESLEFEQLFETPAGERPASRTLLIATFLAMLELVRLAAIHIYQGLSDAQVPEGPIRLRRNTGAGAPAWPASADALSP